ncbi:MAG: hypothetical protein HY077_00260 [Elusimicrobia bacterium]|nr:hypothetical protein [Elusimicrobiota bacterium]
MAPPLLARAKLILSPALFFGLLLCVLWILARFLPDARAIEVLAGAAAAALGLAQAQLLIGAVSSPDIDAAAGPPWLGRLGRLAPPPEFSRWATRLFFALVWVLLSRLLSGVFLNRMVGGDMSETLGSSLGGLRAAVQRYRAGHAGAFPDRLDGPAAIPAAWSSRSDYGRRLVPHPVSTEVESYGGEACRGVTNANINFVNLKDTGHWGYVKDPKSPCWGIVFVDCTHSDFEGRLWASY